MFPSTFPPPLAATGTMSYLGKLFLLSNKKFSENRKKTWHQHEQRLWGEDAPSSWQLNISHPFSVRIHAFLFGDHGGVMLAVKRFSPTKEALYSINAGQTWYVFTIQRRGTERTVMSFHRQSGGKTTTTIFKRSSLYWRKEPPPPNFEDDNRHV